jgi:histidyl-tRNA synthetase
LSAPKLKAPRGTYDVLGEQAHERATLEARARALLEGAGYERIETPTFEATELFARGVGESTDIVRKEMFTFEDASERSLTLRPEGTAPVCRAYVEHGMHKRRQPVKLWYLSSFFRHERAQAGRYRQFWQVGAEAIGSEDPAVDAESIALLAALLEQMGVREVRLRLSSLGSPEARAEYRERLQAYLRAHEAELSDDVRARIELNPLRAFDAKDRGTQAVMAEAPRLFGAITPEDREHFDTVTAMLDDAGLTWERDETLVRGLDYYTRTVFEFESAALGAQSGVGGGGRYDGLVEALGGPPAPGCGWAAGIERILLASDDAAGAVSGPPTPAPPVDLFVAFADTAQRADAFGLTVEARRAGLGAQMELAGRSLKGQLRQADRVAARFVAILSAEGAALKDMESGDQRDVEPAAVVRDVLRGRGPA